MILSLTQFVKRHTDVLWIALQCIVNVLNLDPIMNRIQNKKWINPNSASVNYLQPEYDVAAG